MKARNPSTGTLETVYVKALDSMPVGAEIDFDGDSADIPTGWEQVTPTVQTLWTNSSPTSGFTAQTIELLSSDYNYLEIYFRTFTNQDLVKSVKIEKGQNALLDCAFLFGTRNYLGTRAVTYTDATHLAIGEGRTIIQDNNLANGVDNGWVIPIKIIGIKEV